MRLVAAQQAGSATDRVARILADFLAGLWKQPVVVDNRPGASGAIGTQIAARAEPDGYTLLVGGTSSLVTHPEIVPDVGFDAERDFVAIVRVAYVPFVLAVNLVAGRVDARVSELDAVLPHATAGTVRILAVAGQRRSSQIPEAPTLAESGVPGVELTPWYGVLAPVGIDP